MVSEILFGEDRLESFASRVTDTQTQQRHKTCQRRSKTAEERKGGEMREVE